MARPKNIGQVAVITRTLILVGNIKGYWRALAQAFENAGQKMKGVGFPARRASKPLARLAQVKLALDVLLIYGNAGGAAVQNAANGRAVGFTKGCEAQDTAKCIASHQSFPPGAAFAAPLSA